MVKRVIVDNKEPEESNFKLPSEREHLMVITDVNPLVVPDGTDDNIQIVNLEIVGGDEEGLTLLNRYNLDQNDKAFYYTRLFLKAIGEPYKGEFDIDPNRWLSKQFYATIKHTESKGKTYANIGEYNFDKKIEQQYQSPVGEIKNPDGIKSPEEINWNA